jgi:Xaa-Pro aminopeptidase
VLKTLEEKVRPGMLAEEVWALAVSVVEKLGLRGYFMHHGEPMKFVGHGVGLQIDEPPALAEGQKTPLRAGMVLAIEPKFHVPELGVVGLEDTFYLTPKGLKRITTFSREWIFLKSS